MKVGSLVVILPYEPSAQLKQFIKWRPINDGKTIYTVRTLEGITDQGVVFEEGIMGYNHLGIEIGIWIGVVKEIQPPISSEEIAELVEDACCVEKA